MSACLGGGIAGGCQGGIVGQGLTGADTGAGAGGVTTTTTTTGPGGAATTTTSATTGTSSSSGLGGAGGMTGSTSTSSGGGQGGNACAASCGPTELCDPAHLGFDDNCDGQVDEGCPCQPGQAHWCFAGDPKYRNTPGCFDGTEICTPQGVWGPCLGGVHATPPDNCFLDDTSGCHAITARPYTVVDLSQGIGSFGMGQAGSQSYTVACPPGVSTCPGVTGLSFSPQQAGEHTVTYTRAVQGNPLTCTFPLIVAQPGLRIELSWEHQPADMGVDLDLHVHQPADTNPWGVSPPVEQDCTWSSCTVNDFMPPQVPESPIWFAGPPAMPPTPVNWDKGPTNAQNLCYGDPRGIGEDWQQLGMGCHNPRLDCDNITCDYSLTDPNNPAFWYRWRRTWSTSTTRPLQQRGLRVAVDYYNNHGLTYDVHPEIKIYCNGALAGDLGPNGYYAPEAPVTPGSRPARRCERGRLRQPGSGSQATWCSRPTLAAGRSARSPRPYADPDQQPGRRCSPSTPTRRRPSRRRTRRCREGLAIVRSVREG